MKSKGKISLDFDSTLSENKVQKMAMWLISQGFEVWIVTSRTSTEVAIEKNLWWKFQENEDLFKIADKVGIKKENIHFTNYGLKSEFLEDKDFILHLDDDDIELREIDMLNTNIRTIHVLKDDWWNIIKEMV